MPRRAGRAVLGGFFGVLVACLAPGTASAEPAYDPPRATLSLPLGPSPDVSPPADAKLDCWIYDGFAVVSKNDPALMGAETTVRLDPGNKAGNAICEAGFPGRALSLEDADGYPAGVAGRFLFLDAPDGFGVLTEMDVYDVQTGKRVWKTEYNFKQPVTLRRAGGKIGVEFFQSLKAACVPGKDGAGCWDRILADNKIAKSAGLKPPDCKGLGAGDVAQLSTAAVVDDLGAPKMRLLGGLVTCDPAP